MAPSITEAVSQTTEHIQEKLAAINVKEVHNGHTEEVENPAPAVQEPEVKEVSPAVQAPEVKKAESQEVKPTEELEVKPTEESQIKPVDHLETNHKEPLELSGALDIFQSFDVTPVIGREFVGVDLAAWLTAPNSDELIRDLAITSKSLTLSLIPSHIA